MEIRVGRQHVAHVDDSDYELVSGYNWVPFKDRNATYARRRWFADGHHRYQFMHNLILGAVGVDHVDRDGLNNRRENLRCASNAQNQANRRCQAHSSAYKGVFWAADRNAWRASIRVDGRTRHLGQFDDEHAAAQAYDVAAREFHGDFAGVNFA
jgi:HNH endonuclease/AP2 domain